MFRIVKMIWSKFRYYRQLNNRRVRENVRLEP